MALRVYKYGEKLLREKSQPVGFVDDRLRRLTDEMIATMHDAGGVGLAAPQVGILERFCVIDVPASCDEEDDAAFNAPIEMPLKLFNPEIISFEGTVCDKEGCLSLPKIGGTITRAAQVVCQYQDENNKPQIITARGYVARAIQHEIDHLNGILFIDKIAE